MLSFRNVFRAILLLYVAFWAGGGGYSVVFSW